MAESILRRIARRFGLVTAQQPASTRTYAAAKQTRQTVGFGSWSNGSADSELAGSLTLLRSRSRQMMRDNPYAKRARTLIVNNVIGAGIGMQAQVMTTRGELSQRINDEIEQAHSDWSDAQHSHTGGALHFCDLERAALGQIVEAGEVFVRKHFAAFGGSQIPLALELIEAERVAGEFESVNALMPPGHGTVRMGIEVDAFGRAIAYYVRRRHPGDIRFHEAGEDRFERVPADQMFHLRLIDRWPQTRGEPWLHAVLRKLDDMNEYSASEVAAARAASYYFGTIKTPAPDAPLATVPAEGSAPPQMDIEPGMIQQLAPGEELDFHSPNRPNTAIDPFIRYMLREIAAGVGPSYESLSRDYSQSNYSSSRLALLDDRDLWRVLQQWWLRSFRVPLHRLWLQQAVFAGALSSLPASQYAADPRKFEAVLFKPRGWSWVDPTKEVEAYKQAVRAGFTTVTDVIAQTAGGQDIEDVIATRKRERQMLEDAGIDVDTDPAEFDAAGKVQAEPGDAAAAVADAAGEPMNPGGDGIAAANPRSRVIPLTR